MGRVAIPYLAILVTLTVIDLVWLGLITPDFYKKQIGPLGLEKPSLPVAVVFYCLYAAGIRLFVLPPAIDADRWTLAVLMGGFFGLCAYGTYDLSNMATLVRWPAALVAVDMAWGVTLTAVVSLVGFLVARQLGT
jgi:uncharacterized membrane protein